MALSFWARTSGTWINIATVVVGTAGGLGLRSRLSPNLQNIVVQGVGLLTLWLGMQMAGSLSDVQAGPIAGPILGLLAIAIGGICGELLQIEARLNAIGDWLKHRFRGRGRFTEGFVAASLLFCVGPLTLVGSLNNGLTGDDTLLALKAAMDGISAIALTASYGIGAGFSIATIATYQGGLSLAAGALTTVLPEPATDPRILLATGVGGLSILGLGLNLLEVSRIRVASFLPAIALAPFIYAIAARVLG